MFFFFKQKTAYEMRISDWSSDVCSSDLHLAARLVGLRRRASRTEVFEINAYRVGNGFDRPAADRAIVAIDGAAHLLFDIVSKRFQPFLSLKTDNIISEEGFHQRPMMRQRHEQTRRRPGNMQENADRSEEHTFELKSLMRTAYAVFFLKK